MCTACSPVRLGQAGPCLRCQVGGERRRSYTWMRRWARNWRAVGGPEEGRGSAGLARRLQVPCKCLSACAGACVVVSTCWPNSDLVDPEGNTTGERSVRLFALCAGFGSRRF
jgi:hypothetical protein